MRDVKCKTDNVVKFSVQQLTEMEQKRTRKNKVYSEQTLEVECISKGKTHKNYEFSFDSRRWLIVCMGRKTNVFPGILKIPPIFLKIT